MSQQHTSRRAVAIVVAIASVIVLAFAAPASAAAPATAPTVIGPDGASVTENPTLRWQALPDVTKYRVQVSSSPTFASLLWSADTLNVSATPPTDLPLGTTHWRVAGMDGSSVGPYAQASFTRTKADAPQLLAPADGVTLNHPAEPVVLRWRAVPGAKDYRVEVDDAPDFIGATTVVTDSTNWALLQTQPIGQTFYWRVQGQGSTNGVNTEYSVTRSYQLSWGPEGAPATPVLSSPAPGATVTDVVFRWSAVTGAARYQLQVSPNGDWANNLILEQIVKGTSYSPAITLNNASYYWRVRALDARTPTANAGPWSPDGRQFTREWTNEPRLVSPADNDNNVQEFLLQWDPVPYASAYEISVGTDRNFSPNTFRTCTTNHTDWAPSTYETARPTRPGACDLTDSITNRRLYLAPGVRYYWRVRGLDQPAGTTAAVLGRFSETRSFTYLPRRVGGPLTEAAPQPTGPTGSVEVPRMSWSAVRGATSYDVEVYRGGTRVVSATTYGTSYMPTLRYPVDTALTWRVRTADVDAGKGPWVPGPDFTLLASEAATATTVDLVAPAAGAASVDQPEMDWDPVVGAHRYEVRLFPAGSSVYTRLYDTNESSNATDGDPFRSAFTPTAPIAPGDYEWQVVALNVVGGTLATSERRPITVSDLSEASLTAPVTVPSTASAGAKAAADCVEACPATPLMRWEPVPQAGFYRVHVALDPAFTNVVRIYRTTQTSLRPPEALLDNQAGQSYYWFVQPCRSASLCGRFDSGVFDQAGAFRKESRPIALTAPANAANVADQVTFSWTAPSAQWLATKSNDDVEARTYRLQVSTVPDFGTLIDEVEVDQTTYTAWSKTYPEGPLYWRVQARDGTGNYLTLSPARTLTKASPKLVVTSPTNGASLGGLPVLEWNAQSFAAGYQVEYYRNGDTTWTASNRVQTTSTQLSADTMLRSLPLGVYAYRVRRVDVDNRPGPWTNARTFTVVGTAPTLTSPANGAVFTRSRVLLEWDRSDGAVKYEVETSATAGFGSVIERQTTVMTAWAPVKTYPNGRIYWRVRALDAAGSSLGLSEVRSYEHDLTRPSAAVTSVVAGPGSVTVKWTATAVPAVGPLRSMVVTSYPGGGTTPGASITLPGSRREVVFTGLVNDTKYRFTVTPYDDDGRGVESTRSSEVTPRKYAPLSSVDRFIDRQYQDLLGRAPTSAEKSLWRTRLQGTSKADDLVMSLWTSSGHAGVMPPITRLYSAYFLRVPDYPGIVYWSDQLRSGKRSLTASANFFADSAEFRTRYGALSNRRFVERVYQNVLGRLGEESGMAFWTSELDRGRRTRGQVMVGFSESPEYKAKFGPEIDAALVTIEMLRRTPTQTERDALAARLRGGTTLRQVMVETLASTEYAQRGT